MLADQARRSVPFPRGGRTPQGEGEGTFGLRGRFGAGGSLPSSDRTLGLYGMPDR